MSPLTPKQVRESLGSARYAALARLGMDVASLATLDPNLVRDARLLVPIDVRALLVSEKGAVQAVPTATVIPISQKGAEPASVMPVPPKAFGDAVDRDAGVHLHWAMPDGLTRGNVGAVTDAPIPAGNPTGLPPLPDRWVVVRMNHVDSSARAWIIESDRGDHHDLAGWVEPGAPDATATVGSSGRRIIASASLNAAAGGDLSWAAIYDAVVDRFAFHDDLTDIPLKQRQGLALTYMVAGWWSDPTLDPLRDCTTVAAYHQRASELGWLAPEPTGLVDASRTESRNSEARQHFIPKSDVSESSRYDASTDPRVPITGASAGAHASYKLPEGPAMPRVSLLHGTVTGVRLDGGPDLAPAADAIEVAIGPTGFAALSALLADGTGDARLASERLLAAFASGLLATIDQPNGLVAVDDDRHASAFVAFSGPQRAKPDRVAEGDIMHTGGATRGPFPPKEHRPSREETGKGLAVRLTKRKESDVLAAANEKRRPSGGRPTKSPRTYRDIAVPGPRSFAPTDLSFVLRGARRSLRHGADGRFMADGLLACRLPSQVIAGYDGLLDGHQLPAGLQSLHSGSIPGEVDLLLREAVLTDPYRWKQLADWARGGHSRGAVENRVKAELAMRSVVMPTRQDDASDALHKASIMRGHDASRVGATRWAQPWVPLWCDWEIELAVDDSVDRWTLAEIDFDVRADQKAEGSSSRTLSGRSLLTSSASRALAGRIRQWLEDEDARDAAGLGQLAEGEEADLAAAAAAADGLDVLAGAFTGIRETLLGLDPVDASRVVIDASGAPTTRPLATDLPMLLAGGAARITKLRIVDSFGRWRDVPAASLAKIEVASSLAHADGAPHLLLRPRLTRPARIAFRFVDPATADGKDDVEAYVDQEHPDGGVSPIAGWLLPDHVDESLEFFDSKGTALGQLMHDELTGGVVWEGAPGRNEPIGAPPDPGTDIGARHATRLAAGVVAADATARRSETPPTESALSALLRGIDTTLWTIDPLGSLGTGAVAGLVGRPIAVVRAVLRLDVIDDLDVLSYPPSPDRAARAQRFAELAMREIRVRIGSLTRTDDSILAYAVDADYSQLRLVAPEVRADARVNARRRGQLGTYGHGAESEPATAPIDHPFVNGPTDVALRSAQTVHLTMLMMPGGKAHATCGLLPRKSLALAREWCFRALARISPSFRVGPVLVDPTTIRLPMITGLGKQQTFTRRDTAQSWRDDPISAATQTAYLPDQPSELQEGWIRVVQHVDPDAT